MCNSGGGCCCCCCGGDVPPDDAIGVDDGDVLMMAVVGVRAISADDDDGCSDTDGGGGGGGGGLSSYRPPFIIVHQLSPGPAVGVGHPAPVVTSCSPPPYSVPTAASPRSPMMIIVVVSDGFRSETTGHAVEWRCAAVGVDGAQSVVWVMYMCII